MRRLPLLGMRRLLLLGMMLSLLVPMRSQQMWQYSNPQARMVFFNRSVAEHIPHMTRMQLTGITMHNQLWNRDSNQCYHPKPALLLFTDWADDGNGGVNCFPINNIQIGMAPMNSAFYVAPSVERYHHLFAHEETHVVMTDKATCGDMGWRRVFGNKVPVDNMHPVSAVWSYLTAPRWYAPRWYHEGIACFMETWMGGGMGRALGGYDEMYFRSLIQEKRSLSSVVGLESEGSTSDFQLGTNAYLYGTRFVNYLALRYGVDSLVRFYNRTPDSYRFFARQFRSVYGISLRQAWSEWQQEEQRHQQANLQLIAHYPITPVRTITDEALGSVCKPLYDSASRTLYVAANRPGSLAQIDAIGLDDGHVRKLSLVDDPRLYLTAYVAFDAKRNRLIYTTQNQNYRGLRVLQMPSGKAIDKQKFQRISDPVYDNAGDCLYGIVTSNGSQHLVRYDSTLRKRTMLYTFPFGNEAFDLDVSHDGRMLALTLSGNNGEHSLLLFNVADLDSARYRYRVVAELPDANLSAFRFGLGDTCLYGSSYYTGVSNLWRIRLSDGQMELLSNSTSGLFSPVQISADSLLALQFERNGLRPVTLAINPIHDAEAITLFGQRTYQHNPQQLDGINILREPLPKIDFGQVYDSIRPYKPIHEMRLAGAYPSVTGFVDREGFNQMTPVVGYRFQIQDPVGISSAKLFVGISPWSHNPTENKIHADLNWHYRFWDFAAAWNHSDFYDLFGPIRTSRKGYSASITYSRSNRLLAPLNTKWGVTVGAYGLMDALPLAQNIAIGADVRSFQALSGYYHITKTRKSLGGIKDEQGWQLGTDDYAYLVGGKIYPTFTLTANGGVLLPVLRNTSLWLRNTIGTTLANDDSPFGYNYFGGFQNNWVDCSNPYRVSSLHNYNAMPGAEIDQLQARSFVRSQLQLDLQPLRYNNFGLLFLYPTWTQLSLFGGGLIASEANRAGHTASYINTGAELSTEVVLFNYLRTTWSVGYAYIVGSESSPFGHASHEWMFTLKLL